MFKVIADNGNSRTVESRAEAEDVKEDMEGLGMEVTIEAPDSKADGGKAETHTVEHIESPDNAQREATDYDLPDEGPRVDEDPLVWMPDEFTDTVDGTTAINRKGFEMIAHHYGIECETEMIVSPIESEYEVVIHKATAVDADGNTHVAYGEAHSSDVPQDVMVRMSDTRAHKRAISRASGVGMVAVEELQSEL
jgi:hypothetical protein